MELTMMKDNDTAGIDFVSDGFSGKIQNITLLDYLQTLFASGATKAIHIISIEKEGIVVVNKGAVIYAAQAQLRGEEAFYEILSWESGSFIEQRLDQMPIPNINKDNTYLLLEATRRKDERTSGQQEIASIGDRESTVPVANSAEIESIAKETRMLSEMLKKEPNVYEYGIYNQHDVLQSKSANALSLSHIKPSLYLSLGKEQQLLMNSGSLLYMVIKTKQDIQYVLFNYNASRVVVELDPKIRPLDFLHTTTQYATSKQ